MHEGRKTVRGEESCRRRRELPEGKKVVLHAEQRMQDLPP
ncbi:hypothetical protein EVA_03960 [gut metagenome]|uniref:Uncharacterized protein n=1 Tax=gut metagenome TaxID=749906 RepID=J9H2X7_9ZZZZ